MQLEQLLVCYAEYGGDHISESCKVQCAMKIQFDLT